MTNLSTNIFGIFPHGASFMLREKEIKPLTLADVSAVPAVVTRIISREVN